MSPMAIAASVSTTNSFSRARTRALRSSTESFRINCFQPRLGGQFRPTSSPDNRDMTVPTGTPTTAAMFLYERPSSSRSTMTSRKSTGSDSTRSAPARLPLQHQRFGAEAVVASLVHRLLVGRHATCVAPFRHASVPRVPHDRQQPRARIVIPSDGRKRSARTAASCNTSSASASLFVSHRA